MCMYHLGNALSCECLFSEASLDVIEYLGMGRVRLVEDILQCKIGRPETVAEVLRENPTTIWEYQGTNLNEY